MKRLSLNTQIIAAATLGTLLGIYLNEGARTMALHGDSLSALQLLGDLFVALLKMILIPLVFTSIAAGVASLSGHAHSGRIWKSTLAYYLGTTALAATVGLLMLNLFEPGKGMEIALFQSGSETTFQPHAVDTGEFVHDFLKGLFVNPIKAMAEGSIMPVVIFAMIFGLGIAHLNHPTKGLQALLNELLEVILVIVNGVMKVAPVGVFALIAHLVATQEIGLFDNLALFIAVVVGGLLIHALLVLPGLCLLLTRRNPWRVIAGIQEALLTAFATCSSSATLAVTMRSVTDNLGVSPQTARFVLPLGATMNMDGTALYEAGAALFIANLAGLELGLTQQIVVCLMAILASVGAPGLPSAGMVTMIMVLQSVGLPLEAVAILLPIDRLLDAVRTTVNVEGDAIGAFVVDHLSSIDHPKAG